MTPFVRKFWQRVFLYTSMTASNVAREGQIAAISKAYKA